MRGAFGVDAPTSSGVGGDKYHCGAEVDRYELEFSLQHLLMTRKGSPVMQTRRAERDQAF